MTNECDSLLWRAALNASVFSAICRPAHHAVIEQLAPQERGIGEGMVRFEEVVQFLLAENLAGWNA